VAGLGAALATGFAARTYYLARRTAVSDRYAAAIEQLRADDEAARVSAVGELARIARDAPERHPDAMRVLAVFVREHTRDDDSTPASIQAACEEIAQRKTNRDGGLVVDLSGADLRGVRIDGAKLKNAKLGHARLDDAWLRKAELDGVVLTNARGPSVRLDGAKLRDASVDGAVLTAATLDGADARRASFDNTTLSETSLLGTDLRDTTGLHVQDGTIRGGIANARTKLPG
jgi:hypothetical protein